MSLVYAVRDDNGLRKLVAIRCDMCEKEIAPGPDILNSGWERIGTDKYEIDYCPVCWAQWMAD